MWVSYDLAGIKGALIAASRQYKLLNTARKTIISSNSIRSGRLNDNTIIDTTTVKQHKSLLFETPSAFMWRLLWINLRLSPMIAN